MARYQVALILAMFFWGSSATLTKTALEGMAPMSLLAIQLAASSAVLWTVLLIRGYRRTTGHIRLMLLGFFEPALSYALINFGLIHTTAANAALLVGMESFFAMGLSFIFLRERLSRRMLLATAMALAGVILLEGSGATASLRIGDLLVLAGVLSAAVYVVLAGSTAKKVDALTMTTYQFTYGLAFAVPVACFQWLTGAESVPIGEPVSAWVVAAVSGIVGYALSFLLYNYAISRVRTSYAAIALNLIPVFGVAVAVVFLSEGLTIWQVVSGVLIIAGISVYSGHEARDETAGVPDGHGHAELERN
ncbi:membrane protein [Microbispora rosea subsp. aerata]|nr:DMT family transporter [Microbispora rosea]GGO03752.1 membrane protein [Microbispora rosea subsp. aerata]GIH54863.1 membrane protein [Microbispora rosea subsp. aerata]GLJ83663.1 membrane protein [Microbispora rosea subsp. aerata]